MLDCPAHSEDLELCVRNGEGFRFIDEQGESFAGLVAESPCIDK